MEKAEKIQQQLDEWKKEYNIDQYTVEFGGWCNMDTVNPRKWILGKCFYVNRRRCVINLGYKFEDRKLGWIEMSTVWHEFCHALAYLEDGVNDSHNNHWKELRRKKPLYLIGDWVGKIVYPFL